MNKKIMLAVLIAVAFTLIIGTAKAQIAVSIRVEDSGGNSIVESTVPVNTVAYVYCTYEDKSGSVSATGIMKVYHDGIYKETLYNGVVTDGQTIMKTYKMTVPGTYEFKWDVTKATAGGYSISCTTERAVVKARVMLVVPEPGTIAGLAMALSAFGLLAIRKIRQ